MITESDKPYQYNEAQQNLPSELNGGHQQFAQQYPPHLAYYPEPNRREMGSWLKSMLLMGVGMGAVVATEKFAPDEYKVSTLLGTFEANIEKEVQGQVKDIETYYASALEDYKGEVSTFVEASNSSVRAHNDAVLQYYKAAYDRAQVLTQAVVNLRMFVVQKFANIAETLNAPDLGISGGALALGRLINAFENGAGDPFTIYGNQGGDDAAKRLEDYINRGMAVDLPDFENMLPTPDDVQAELDEIELPDSPEPPKLMRYTERDIIGNNKNDE